MKSKILKRTMAAALALTIVGGIPVAFDGNRIFQPAVTADAADEGSAVLNEETGVLTLSGRITKELLTEYKFRVEKIVCEQGTVLPADSSGLFSNGNIGEVIEIDLSNMMIDTASLIVDQCKGMEFDEFQETLMALPLVMYLPFPEFQVW